MELSLFQLDISRIELEIPIVFNITHIVSSSPLCFHIAIFLSMFIVLDKILSIEQCIVSNNMTMERACFTGPKNIKWFDDVKNYYIIKKVSLLLNGLPGSSEGSRFLPLASSSLLEPDNANFKRLEETFITKRKWCDVHLCTNCSLPRKIKLKHKLKKNGNT